MAQEVTTFFSDTEAALGTASSMPVQSRQTRTAITLAGGVRWERLTPGPDHDVDFVVRPDGEQLAELGAEQVALLAELQRTSGGNSAEILDTVVGTIRERAEMRRLVRTLTAQGRMARWILTALPVFYLCWVANLFVPTAGPNDPIARYRWDFDGNGTVDLNSVNPTVSHSFRDTGSFPVTLTVVDDPATTLSSSSSTT